MSVYLVTREGQELGTFKTSKIEKGLKSGFFRESDLGWREVSGWQGLTEIVGTPTSPQTEVPSGTTPANPDSFNPYSAPTAVAQAGSSGVVSLEVMQALAGTKPWVRFISVLLWIGCILFLLFHLNHLFSGAPESVAYRIGSTCRYVLIIYPALKLTKYASKIAHLTESRSLADLAAALTEQRRFWKFCGILTILYVSMDLLFVIGDFLTGRH